MKRTVITGQNRDWLVGHVEERENEDDQWIKSLHSDWVFSRPIEFVNGKRVHETQMGIPIAGEAIAYCLPKDF